MSSRSLLLSQLHISETSLYRGSLQTVTSTALDWRSSSRQVHTRRNAGTSSSTSLQTMPDTDWYFIARFIWNFHVQKGADYLAQMTWMYTRIENAHNFFRVLALTGYSNDSWPYVTLLSFRF